MKLSISHATSDKPFADALRTFITSTFIEPVEVAFSSRRGSSSGLSRRWSRQAARARRGSGSWPDVKQLFRHATKSPRTRGSPRTWTASRSQARGQKKLILASDATRRHWISPRHWLVSDAQPTHLAGPGSPGLASDATAALDRGIGKHGASADETRCEIRVPCKRHVEEWAYDGAHEVK